MKKKLLVGTMALCLTASLFGCGNGKATTAAPDTTTGAPETTTSAPETTTAPEATTAE